jgi:hypothetical protein
MRLLSLLIEHGAPFQVKLVETGPGDVGRDDALGGNPRTRELVEGIIFRLLVALNVAPPLDIG